MSAGQVLRDERRSGPPIWIPFAALVAAAWVTAALLGEMTLGGQSLTPAASAAAAGAALLAGVSPPARRPLPVIAGLFALLAVPAALAVAASGSDARPFVAAVAALVAAGAIFGGRDEVTRLRAAAMAGVGVAMLVATVAANGGWRLTPAGRPAAVALVAAGAAMAMAASGAIVPVAALRPLLVPGLVCALVGAPGLGGPALPLIASACAVSVATLRPPLALALLAVATAGLPGGQPVAALIGTGAVLAVAIDLPAAGLAALPGGVALTALLTDPGPALPRVSVAAAGLTIAVGIAMSLRGAARVEVERRRLPAIAAAGWFVVAPGTWSWAGDAGLRPYDTGMVRAFAVAGLALVWMSLAPRIAEVSAARRQR